MRLMLAGCLALLAACPKVDRPLGDTGDTGDTTGGSATSAPGTTTGTTTEPSPTTTTIPTTTDVSDAGDSNNNPGLCGDGLCGQFWERWDACDLEGTIDGCPCFPEEGEKCLAAWDDLITCFDQTPCAEILADGEGPCWLAFDHAYNQCILGEDGCDVFVQGGGPDDGTCTFGEECIDQPEKYVTCDAAMCTCTIDDKLVGTCAADGVCDDPDAQNADKIAACCGT